MPQNPDLFPQDYPDLCPRTELQEEDCCDELRDLIRKLRNQHLLAARRAGQSIAELQNQGLIEECCFIQIPVNTDPPPVNPPPQPPPPPPPNPGSRSVFFGGGDFQGIHGQVEKFLFDTLVVSTMDFAITKRARHSSASSSANGYWFGGETDWGNRINGIEAIRFDTEARKSVGATLSYAYFYTNSAYSETKGFVAGGGVSNVGHDRFTFANETTAAGGTIPGVLLALAGGQSPAKAYFAGGAGNWATIAAIPFATEVPGMIGATLSRFRQCPGSLSAARKWYIGGGSSKDANQVPEYTRSFDALRFDTETCAAIGAQLAIATDDLWGFAGSGTWGVIAGGFFETPARLIQKFRFDAETCETINATLRRGGRYPVPVGKP